MLRTAAGLLLVAGVLPVCCTDFARAQSAAETASADGSALIDQTTLPSAVDLKGSRPQADPSVLPPAATTLPESMESLQAPPSLALPDQTDQVRIRELRPLTLAEVEQLAEVNNPNLKAVVSQVQQAKSGLRAALARWYPTLDLSANGLPQYLGGEQQNFDQRRTENINPVTGESTPTGVPAGVRTTTSRWTANFGARLNWNLIDPGRVPEIAAARDTYERSREAYLIALRELRLQVALEYFDLQRRDEQVRIGQQSVRASIVSLRDARARFQAGVATKLEVLEAITQLARDQQLLTNAIGDQAEFRRNLAATLDLPQDVTPTAAAPARVIGTWIPSLQESIVAAYAFREELDQLLLDISINNSNANLSLSAVQPVLSIFNNFSTQRFQGEANVVTPPEDQVYGWSFDNAVGLSATWNIFDGGRARAQYRQNKERAEQSRFNFATQRNTIRSEVEASFYELSESQQDIRTTAREVLSATESLRLARLRFQAGVTTQREVVDNQRDLTNAQIRYADAVLNYNGSLAQLRRRTGLDQVQSCPAIDLPAEKPEALGVGQILIEPTPYRPSCEASQMGV